MSPIVIPEYNSSYNCAGHLPPGRSKCPTTPHFLILYLLLHFPVSVIITLNTISLFNRLKSFTHHKGGTWWYLVHGCQAKKSLFGKIWKTIAWFVTMGPRCSSDSMRDIWTERCFTFQAMYCSEILQRLAWTIFVPMMHRSTDFICERLDIIFLMPVIRLLEHRFP